MSCSFADIERLFYKGASGVLIGYTLSALGMDHSYNSGSVAISA